MKSILFSAEAGAGFDARLETALNLARATSGHVTALVNMAMTANIVMDPLGSSYVVSEVIDRARDERDTQAKAVETRLAREDVAYDVVCTEGDLVTSLADAARFADVVVVSGGSEIAGDLALTARTPVLMIADDAPLSFPLAKACIGWDGGEEAAFALRCALPILTLCDSVEMVTITEKTGGFPATDALRYLSRHGIHAELEELARRGSTEETLEVAVAKSGAQLLVMGAYGKSRMREFLFGGVTAYFLGKEGDLALLMAH
ncbi:universal stress protein UspA [Novosphingobium sp. PC22D]|uniref:universal stress protein n=1 Tax=Novosphingobium sp. PC22D TaxID=1962403 RepID=UPI000BF01070|nr:universal stress protein [Novosphingobium sp. PC22D]PEQ14205.1 universal stress protein UspA [Novosphingobium sp. PC22D]